MKERAIHLPGAYRARPLRREGGSCEWLLGEDEPVVTESGIVGK